MSVSLLALVLAFVCAQTAGDAPRPNPFAPSLRQLTPQEEAKFEGIVDRFIQFDIGKLPGAAGKKALEDFKKLPPEAIFVLIDGFNRTANMEASCPVVLIGKKIISILGSSDDLKLLTFAKENLGAGVTAKRHLGMLKDVQFSILLRKGAVQRRLAVAGASGSKAPVAMSSAELAKYMTRQSGVQLKELLKQDTPAVKAAAAQEIGSRRLSYGKELLTLLQDSDPRVHQAARTALRQLSGGIDHGPEPDASFGARETAFLRWSEWWTKQGGSVSPP